MKLEKLNNECGNVMMVYENWDIDFIIFDLEI